MIVSILIIIAIVWLIFVLAAHLPFWLLFVLVILLLIGLASGRRV